MGYGVRQGTHRIHLTEFDGSANWVDIKAGRSYGAKQRQVNAGLRYKLGGKGKDSEVDFDFFENRLALFEEAIVDWSLKGDESDPAPMPLTRDTFANRLGEEIGDWLAEEIEGYYGARTLSEDDLKNSNGASTAPSHLVEAFPTSSQ